MFEEVKKVLKEELLVEEEIKLDSNLNDDLHIDSVAALELSLQLEEKYNVYITEDELSELITVNDLVKLLEEKKDNQ